MSNPDSPESRSPEKTAGGLIGQVVGKAKSAAGSLLGNENLKREGNLQQAQTEAEVVAERERKDAELRREDAAVKEQRAEAAAERDRLQTELAADDLHERIELTEAQREREIALSANQTQAAIEHREALQQRAADVTEDAALHRRAAEAADVARLERAAADAERVADTIDPEAK
jgi:uncharacterized protein YjbJ (UPF0337 family)